MCYFLFWIVLLPIIIFLRYVDSFKQSFVRIYILLFYCQYLIKHCLNLLNLLSFKIEFSIILIRGNLTQIII